MVENHMSAFQCGGKEKRGTIDNLFQLRALIDDYRYKGRDLHIYYGDLKNGSTSYGY